MILCGCSVYIRRVLSVFSESACARAASPAHDPKCTALYIYAQRLLFQCLYFMIYWLIFTRCIWKQADRNMRRSHIRRPSHPIAYRAQSSTSINIRILSINLLYLPLTTTTVRHTKPWFVLINLSYKSRKTRRAFYDCATPWKYSNEFVCAKLVDMSAGPTCGALSNSLLFTFWCLRIRTRVMYFWMLRCWRTNYTLNIWWVLFFFRKINEKYFSILFALYSYIFGYFFLHSQYANLLCANLNK